MPLLCVGSVFAITIYQQRSIYHEIKECVNLEINKKFEMNFITSYEHIDETVQYEIDVSQIESDILYCRIHSRYQYSSNIYNNVWIRYTTSAVQSWYCQCNIGTRTSGCSAHYLVFFLYHQCNTWKVNRQLSSVDDSGHY